MDTTVLIVDDEPRCVRLVEVNLKTEGYKILSGRDGRQAVELVARHNPDLVLLDVLMPGMDGLAACRRIRDFSTVPIIMLTARGSEADRVTGLDAGADDYIVKPFSAPELLARVRAMLRRSRMASEVEHAPVFVHGDLEVHLPDARVTVGGQPVSLSPTEYRLLLHFIHHAGQVQSAESLLAEVWGPEYGNARSILWVTLSRLRQKIEADPHRPRHVVTRSRLGYYMPVAAEDR